MYRIKQDLIYNIEQETDIDTILNTWSLGKKTKYELYQSSRVSVNGIVKKQSCPLFVNDVLTIDTQTFHSRIAKSNFDIIYEDDILLIVYKPKSYLVHSDGCSSNNMQDELRQSYKGKVKQELQAIHRLDVDTSGILLFSKSSFFQPKLDTMISKNEIQRTYLAVVEGNCPSQIIDKPIARDRHDSKLMRISPDGKEAITHVSHHKFIKDQSLVSCILETGRTHQIRVHLASVKHAVVGDPLYNIKKSSHNLCLHSYRVVLHHPITNLVIDEKVFPHPEDFPSSFHESHVKLKK